MNLSSPQRRLILRESDIERRRLERLAAAGDPEAGVRLITQKIRTGEISRENVALAASLRDPIARMVEEPSSLIIGSDPIAALRKADLNNDQLINYALDCLEHIIPIVLPQLNLESERTLVTNIMREIREGSPHPHWMFLDDLGEHYYEERRDLALILWSIAYLAEHLAARNLDFGLKTKVIRILADLEIAVPREHEYHRNRLADYLMGRVE